MRYTGVIPADNEDEAQRLEETANGEVQGRGRTRLWWSGQVICCTVLLSSYRPSTSAKYTVTALLMPALKC